MMEAIAIPFDTRRSNLPGIKSVKGRRSILDHLLASELAQVSIPELHMRDLGDDGVYRKMSYCGPFTKLSKRVVIRNGRVVKVLTPPINRLDHACMLHDLAYEFNVDPQSWRDADKSLIREADRIAEISTGIQRKTAKAVARIIRQKAGLHTRNVL